MNKYIKDLWIISKSGVVLFEHLVSEAMNPDLFGSMMSALNIYAGELSGGGISSFNINNNRFVMIREKSYLFITKTLDKYKVSQVKKELGEVAKKFFNSFPDVLKDKWDGGMTSRFTSFKKELTE